MLFGKLGAMLVVVLVIAISLFAVDAACSWVIALLDGKSSSFPAADVVVKAIAAAFLIFTFWAVFGFALATVFRQSALAIGLGLAYALVIELLVFGLLAGLGANIVRPIQQWFPIANSGYLVASFGSVNFRGVQSQAAPYADATHAVVMLLVYIVAFTALGAWLTRTRDVTS
jgi:ABC-type transport system involved in multi-copper enzyme maturation permease subunit